MKQTPEEKANRELMMQLTGWAGIQISTLNYSMVLDHFLDVFLQRLTNRRWRNLECVLKIPSDFPELYKVKEVQSFNELTLN